MTHLIPSILEMVEEKRIAFNPAVELSYLAEKEQQDLFEKMQSMEPASHYNLLEVKEAVHVASCFEINKGKIFLIK